MCEMKKSATRENITFSPDTGLQEIRIPHLGMPKGACCPHLVACDSQPYLLVVRKFTVPG